jgi:hypothetical protein
MSSTYHLATLKRSLTHPAPNFAPCFHNLTNKCACNSFSCTTLSKNPGMPPPPSQIADSTKDNFGSLTADSTTDLTRRPGFAIMLAQPLNQSFFHGYREH